MFEFRSMFSMLTKKLKKVEESSYAKLYVLPSIN